jgi:hypothetical protein
MQADYPEVVETIVKRLKALRSSSALISLVTIHRIVVATIMRMAPEVFEKKAADGTRFRCSDSYLRKWIHGTLNWSERRATRAAQKIPENWEDLCEHALLRLAHQMKEEDIPPELYVNMDQTQVVLVQGLNLTWADTGTKQVSVVGAEEKRAITVVVSVACSGDLLPFQVIYEGATARSLPKRFAKHIDDCKKLGIWFDSSKSDTYWSTQHTMQVLVNKIIAPYFAAQKKKLGLPDKQKAAWQIDIWSVHRSEEFRSWMKKNHSNIKLNYVPAGCTPLFQPCDVGIQRIFKHSLRQSYHEDIVEEVLTQLDEGVEVIKFEKKLGILHDCTVKWIWELYGVLNDKSIIKKVCCTHLSDNVSHNFYRHSRCAVFEASTCHTKV